MYELPDDFDTGVFIGRTLERTSFTTNTVKLSFDGEITVVVESEIQHEGRDQIGSTWVDSGAVPVKESRLMLVEDSDWYECYQLHIGTTEIIV